MTRSACGARHDLPQILLDVSTAFAHPARYRLTARRGRRRRAFRQLTGLDRVEPMTNLLMIPLGDPDMRSVSKSRRGHGHRPGPCSPGPISFGAFATHPRTPRHEGMLRIHRTRRFVLHLHVLELGSDQGEIADLLRVTGKRHRSTAMSSSSSGTGPRRRAIARSISRPALASARSGKARESWRGSARKRRCLLPGRT